MTDIDRISDDDPTHDEDREKCHDGEMQLVVEICNIVVRTTTDCLAFMRGRIVGWVSPWVEPTNLSKEKIEKKSVSWLSADTCQFHKCVIAVFWKKKKN